jgi:hypothetical protein
VASQAGLAVSGVFDPGTRNWQTDVAGHVPVRKIPLSTTMTMKIERDVTVRYDY